MRQTCQLISYIAPAAPATRRLATGSESFLRPEIGFTPKWFHDALGLDFEERWHTDPAYRKESVIAMRAELKRRFPQTPIGGIDRPGSPLDLLTGTFGANTIATIYGVPIRYARDNWPVSEAAYLEDDALEHQEPPDLENNRFFQNLMQQVEWIAQSDGQSCTPQWTWQINHSNKSRLIWNELPGNMALVTLWPRISNPEHRTKKFSLSFLFMIK